MGGLVERQIAEAMEALVNRDTVKAREIIARDAEVNRLDVETDEQCIRLLALHQPAASDLRFITTGLKITTDLERIGDNAVNIAERVLELNEEPQLKPYLDIPRMASVAQSMVKDSLDAFLRDDAALAEEVIERDDEVDGSTTRCIASCSATWPRTHTHPARYSFAVHLQVPRAYRGPCHEYCRDGRVHGQRTNHPPHGQEKT